MYVLESRVRKASSKYKCESYILTLAMESCCYFLVEAKTLTMNIIQWWYLFIPKRGKKSSGPQTLHWPQRRSHLCCHPPSFHLYATPPLRIKKGKAAAKCDCSWSLSVLCTRAELLQSCPTLCDLMDCSHQTPLSVEFSRQEYWSRLPCPPPGDLLTQGWNSCLSGLLHWRVDSWPLAPPGKPLKLLFCRTIFSAE